MVLGNTQSSKNRFSINTKNPREPKKFNICTVLYYTVLCRLAGWLACWLAVLLIELYCIVLYCICTVVYCTVLYCIVLCRLAGWLACWLAVLYRIVLTVLNCTVLYCTALYCTVLYCIVLYCTVLYYTVLYCNVLYCIINTLPHPPHSCTSPATHPHTTPIPSHPPPHHLHSHTSPPARMPVPPSPIQMRPPLAARGWNTNALAAFFDRIRELNATRIKGRSLSCTATSYKFTSMAMNSAYASAAVAAVVDALGALGWPQGSR